MFVRRTKRSSRSVVELENHKNDMKSSLLLRLPATEDETVYWLTCLSGNPGEAVEIEDSGRLPSVRELNQLKDISRGKQVIVLVPGELVTLRELDVPARLTTMMIKSLPYRLEDDLAGDVDDLHISILEHKDERLHVAIVEHHWMEAWQNWLQQAELSWDKLLPDTLALPETVGAIDFYHMGEHWLVRYGKWHTATCDDYWLDHYLANIDEDKSLKRINHGSLQQDNNPLDVLSTEAITLSASLLQGNYEPSGQKKNTTQVWRRAIVLGLVSSLLWLGTNLFDIWQLNNRTQTLQAESKSLYHQLFPGERVIRLIPQMKRKLTELESHQSHDNNLLTQLREIAPMTQSLENLQATSLVYSQDQSLLRITAQAGSMETFTNLRNKLSLTYAVSLDSLEQNGDTITGVIAVRSTR